jgi:hypothetical protein
MNKFREIALAIAIVVVLNLFVNYGVYTFYKPANFEKTCPMELTQKNYANKEECEAVGGEWFEGSTAVYQEILSSSDWRQKRDNKLVRPNGKMSKGLSKQNELLQQKCFYNS